jgi:hypothetical protein
MNTYANWEDWEEKNPDYCQSEYWNYLHSAVTDENFDIKTVEDYHTWCEEEYNMLLEHEYFEE